MHIKELFGFIERSTGTFPREALNEIIKRKEEAVPVLLENLIKVRDNPEKYTLDLEYIGHLIATYLLVGLRVPEAYPLIVDLLSLKGESSDQLYGDMIIEDGGRILASICGGDIEPIIKLVENPEVYDSVREQAVHAIAVLLRNGLLQREIVISQFSIWLNSSLIDNKKSVITSIVNSCNGFYPEELYKEIKQAFKDNKVDSRVISLKEIEETLKRSKEEVLDDAQYDPYLDLIDDAIGELARWGTLYLREDDMHNMMF